MRNFNKPCGCNKKCTCGQHGHSEVKPGQQSPTQTSPAQVSPTKQNNEYVGNDVYVPVIHPTHTTVTNHTTYKYMHSYPHTKSVVNSVSEEHYCASPKTNHCKRKPRRRW